MLQSFKIPKDDEKYQWTRHVVEKMRYYKMSVGLVKRIVRSYKRKEVGIAEGTIALMKPTQNKKQEHWVMYKNLAGKKIRVISAWRYPGISPVGDKIPIPDDILEELEGVL